MLTTEQIERYVRLAETSTVVGQILTVPQDGGWVSALTDKEEVIATGLAFEDARFLAVARQAVLEIGRELLALWSYTDYLLSSDAPVDFETWVKRIEVEERR